MLEEGYMFITKDEKISFNKEAKKSVEKLYELLKKQGELHDYIPYLMGEDAENLLI